MPRCFFEKRSAPFSAMITWDVALGTMTPPIPPAGTPSSDKLPAAPVFTRGDGREWNKDAWKHPVKNAVRSATLPSGVTAYTLQHSVITDLVRDGLPVLTVAQFSGTSVAMIERHYGHLVRDDAEKALARLAL